MQCAEIVGPGEPLAVVERELPDVPREGLLLRTRYAGVCHSDLHLIDNTVNLGGGRTYSHAEDLGESYQGLVPGHEICGEVLAVGPEVPPSECPLRPGDTVVVYPWQGCGSCEACSQGHNNHCDHNRGGSTDIGQGGGHGGYSTHVPLEDWRMAVRLPRVISPQVGCLLPCSVLTAYTAILNTKVCLDAAVRLRGVANLLVVGAGGVGFWVIVLVKSIFCDRNVRVIAADVTQEKLNAATSVGADDVILWEHGKEADVEENVSKTTMSGYNKIDAAIDLVGSPQTVETTLQTLQRGATLVLIGLAGGQISLSLPTIVSKSVTIQGQRTGSLKALRDLVDLFAVQDVACLPPLEFVKLQDINETHERLRQHKIKSRAIIKFEEEDEVRTNEKR